MAGLHNARSLSHHWQTHLPHDTFLYPSAIPRWFLSELFREACRDWFEPPVWRELGALTEVERFSGSGLSTDYM
jgi:hypothetical protein